MHGYSPGKLRVLVSPDGQQWSSAALIVPRPGDFQELWSKSAEGTSVVPGRYEPPAESDNGIVDLRDANLSVTPRGELMLVGLACRPTKPRLEIRTAAWFSKDGRNWSDPVEIGDPNLVLWKVVWHKGTAYSAGYGFRPDPDRVRLYHSKDGRKFETLVDNILPDWAPPDSSSGETSLVFLKDGRCIAVVRREHAPAEALLGQAEPPYTKWTWKRLNELVFGPELIQLPDGRVWLSGRLMNERRTSLCWLDLENARLHEVLTLSAPRGYDCGYTALVYHEGLLWMSYYSSHDVPKTAIYLAKMKIEPQSD